MAIAVVEQTWGSSPRPVGSMMAVDSEGRICGSVSGGCVEGAVIEAALETIRDREPRRLEFSELKDEDVWAVGLSCGGRISVVVVPADVPALTTAADSARRRESFTLYVGTDPVDISSEEKPGSIAIQYPAPERLVVVGGVHIAVPLLAMAREIGFETILIEPRRSFADAARFPVPPDRVFSTWPEKALADLRIDESTYAVLLTHDPKIDDQALRILLRSSARYIGCLGSRTTQQQRRARLADEGFSDEEVGRIKGPVGLAINARTPGEIAVSILAEMIQVRRSS
jgi:xanthine dehydrogenase accessory factor